MHREDDVGVAGVDDEQHGLAPARLEPSAKLITVTYRAGVPRDNGRESAFRRIGATSSIRGVQVNAMAPLGPPAPRLAKPLKRRQVRREGEAS